MVRRRLLQDEHVQRAAPAPIRDKEVPTRKERRKEARQAKLQQRLHAWSLHQAGKRKRAQKEFLQEVPPPSKLTLPADTKEETEPNGKTLRLSQLSEAASQKQIDRKNRRKIVSRKAKRGRTNFEEYLERETKKTALATAEEDLAIERRLAKKLKVRRGQLGGFDDGMADILDGLDTEVGIIEMEEEEPREQGLVKQKVAPKADDRVLKTQGKGTLSGVSKSASNGMLVNNSTIDVEDTKYMTQKVGCSNEEDDNESSMQEIFSDDLGDSDESAEISEHEVAYSDIEDQEELGLGLESDASECDLENDLADESKEVAEQSGSEEEEKLDLDDGHELEEEEVFLKDRKRMKDFGEGEKQNNGKFKVDAAAVKYVPPHLREKGSTESEEIARIQRRVRGLLNRLSEANVESIASDIAVFFQVHGRRLVTEVVTNEIIGACCGGPRGNDQYAAVFAAYVAGTAAMVGIDFGAKFLASLCSAFEEQYEKEDSLALRNLSLLFSHLYSFSLIPSELVFEVLAMLCKRFEELDVATILTVLQSCGMGLRASDPASMKDFVLSVQQRTAELKQSLSSKSEGTPVSLGKRVQFMLDMICDIKNNKRRSKDEPAPHSRLRKWLRKLGVEDVQLRSVTWGRLLDPAKKGQWWLPGAPLDGVEKLANVVAEMAGAIDAGAAEADRMLQLAASQRMNTDARRSIFFIIMSADDYIDAFEKILRLKLPGKQDREVVRVIVECCLQEQLYNKYYALLLTKLCHHEKHHKFSFQYCLWDHYKQLDTMDKRRSLNLARLTVALIGSFTLSLSIVKVVDFTDIRTLSSKVVVHFLVMFESLLKDFSDDIVWGVFSRIAAVPELTTLRDGLILFLNQHVLREVKKDLEKGALLTKRVKLAKKALGNVGAPFSIEK